MGENAHPFVRELQRQFSQNRIGRREFLRGATLLGLSAPAAYAFVAKVTGEPLAGAARAAMPRGGRLRIGMRVKDVANPHQFDWLEKSNVARQVCEYLAVTGADNVTRPHLLESWETSDDLRTWTLNLRRDVKWHSGRRLLADDVVWNLKRVLDPATGSSMLGLMKDYMLSEAETSTGKTQRLWDPAAIEKLDDFTIRLNARQPQLAVPEHLSHYPMLILDPEEDGTFGPGANGTGPFELVEHAVGSHSRLKGRGDYWGEGPYLDELIFVDLGDDVSASMAAVASKQVDGLFRAEPSQYDTLTGLDHVAVYQTQTAETAVVRGKVDRPPFDDPRVRRALRHAVDPARATELALRGIGAPGEHHHVSPIHPEYAELPAFGRDVPKAKALLAEAGYSDGLDLELTCPAYPEWQKLMVQALVEQWKDAGIKVRLDIVPGARYWDIWKDVPFGCTSWLHRSLGVMTLALAYRSGVAWNESGYANPEFDALLAKAEGILDPDARSEVMAGLERIMQRDGPIVQPVWRANYTVFDKRVKGFRMHPTNYIFGNELAIEAA